jgi:hypothetical protein
MASSLHLPPPHEEEDPMSQSNEPAAPHAPPASDTGSHISADIDRTLERRTAPPHTWQAHAEETIKHDGRKLWQAMKKRPSVGVLVFGGLAVVAADAVGVGEVALGLGVGYAAYRVLRKGRSTDEKVSMGEPAERS